MEIHGEVLARDHKSEDMPSMLLAYFQIGANIPAHPTREFEGWGRLSCSLACGCRWKPSETR